MQVKATVEYHLTLVRTLVRNGYYQKQDNKCWQDVGKRDLYYSLHREYINLYRCTMESRIGVSLKKFKTEALIIPFPRYSLKKNKSLH